MSINVHVATAAQTLSAERAPVVDLIVVTLFELSRGCSKTAGSRYMRWYHFVRVRKTLQTSARNGRNLLRGGLTLTDQALSGLVPPLLRCGRGALS